MFLDPSNWRLWYGKSLASAVDNSLMSAILGLYCHVADLVLEMRDYHCYNITGRAREIARQSPSGAFRDEGKYTSPSQDVQSNVHLVPRFGMILPRCLDTHSLPSLRKKAIVRRRNIVETSDGVLDFSKLPQLVHDSQTRAIVAMLKYLALKNRNDGLSHILQDLERALNRNGLDVFMDRDRDEYFLARPRLFELGMAINRLVSE